MDTFLYSTIFSITCLWASFRSAFLSLVLVIYMFPLEQALQSGIPFLRSGIGLETINIAIALVVAVSIFSQIFRIPQYFWGWINTSTAACFCLYAWSLFTLIWSPGKAIAFDIIYSGLPYFIIIVVLAPLLADSILNFSKTCRAMLIMGIPISLIFLLSPEFDMSSGRLSIHFNSAISSNVLAVGEFGGYLIITAILFQPKNSIVFLNYPLRVMLLIAGSVISIKSGSRGQFFGAIIVSIFLIPVAVQIKSISKFLTTVISIMVFLISIYYIYNITIGDLTSVSSKRFDLNEMLFGTSSAEGRLSNIQTLFFAWISSPTACVIGLGTGAFGIISQTGELYSHNLTADTIFELGIIGFILFITCVVSAIKSCYRLFVYCSMEQERRSVVTVLIGYIAYQLILVNKQGTLWGIPLLFLFTSIAGRLEKRISFEEEDNQAEMPDLLEVDSIVVKNSNLNILDIK